MDDARIYRAIRLQNFLSYGPDEVELELRPLNVLIGQNASGKSNLIQAMKLVRALPRNLAAPLYEGGGVREFLYKGSESKTAKIEIDIADTLNRDEVRHSFSFGPDGQQMRIDRESIESLLNSQRPDTPPFYYRSASGVFSLMGRGRVARPVSSSEGQIELVDGWEKIDVKQKPDTTLSIIAQRNDPDIYPALAYLNGLYEHIRIYANIDLESLNSLRVPQRPDLPDDFVEESGRNLSIILNDLQHRGTLREIEQAIRVVNEDITAITVKISGGTVQTYIHERGLREPIPANRLSDGTLRYLCLLAILKHPSPPPLICLEEPEIGMHPDVISAMAELLVEASTRTQLIVTTHSEMLVSALSHTPEIDRSLRAKSGGDNVEKT